MIEFKIGQIKIGFKIGQIDMLLSKWLWQGQASWASTEIAK
jgi:hypothetical protein